MTSFLDRVRAEKEAELADKKRIRPVSELERLASAVPARDFRRAISGGRAIIAEIKRRSPSVAAFRQNAEPETLAEIYEAGGASAISIVTDERNFGTSLADVRRVKSACRLPVLVKDFVLEDYQVLEARAAGADAVLLIVGMVPAGQVSSFLALVRELGMSALVECHDLRDVDTAIAGGSRIIGINNRDLETLEVSVETTRRLVSRIPEDLLRVSESGINSRDVVEELVSLGVDAFLVGGALLASDDPGGKLRELLGEAGSGSRRTPKENCS